MRKIAALIAACATVAFAFGAQAESRTVRIATEGAYPPFNFKDASGELKGFDVDIAKALCEKAKLTCTYVAQDWDGIIPGLLASKYDAIVASMSITEERKQQVDFTNPYYNTPARFIAAKGSGITDISPAALKGKILGAQSSTIHANYLQDNYKESEVKLYPTQDEVNADLAAGRLDLVLADSVMLYEWLEKTEPGKGYEFVGTPLTDPKWFGDGAGIAIRKDDGELKAALNNALAEIIADGTYKTINDAYFPFSILKE
ncbi:ABC transporter substrate-binding protein [Zavarzinia sp. CC-PAN008]|uniref:ABC transporter substrate-binding protein n=1 Tax=Zavarzinia sp. CC-PAN008 TaxID=3243332 RepID=UPI003F742D40